MNSESLHVEQCGCAEIAHWTEALLVTAFPSTAAHCVTCKMILNIQSAEQFTSTSISLYTVRVAINTAKVKLKLFTPSNFFSRSAFIFEDRF